MISVSLAPGSNDRPRPVMEPRRQGESLYDYLVRSRHEMGVQIELLEALSEARVDLLQTERRQSRRRLHLLIVSEAICAAAAYLGLAHCAIVARDGAVIIAGIISLAALGGGLFIAGVAAFACRFWRRRRA